MRVVLATALASVSATSALTTQATDGRSTSALPSTLRCTATVTYGTYGPSSYPKFNYIGTGACFRTPGGAKLAVSYSVSGIFPVSDYPMLITLTDTRTGAVTNLDEDFYYFDSVGPLLVRGPNGDKGVVLSFDSPYGYVRWVQTY